jgi:probable rRNA maturation factor
LSGSLVIRNRQRALAVNLRLMRRLVRALLADAFGANEVGLGIHLVGTPAITRLNETHLGHAGSTDVITLDYADLPVQTECVRRKAGSPPARPVSSPIHGEIFICLDEAVAQARRFRTSWQSELARYMIHGILHLRGYDDLKAGDRRVMKREEDRLLRGLSRRFPLRKLARDPRMAA